MTHCAPTAPRRPILTVCIFSPRSLPAEGYVITADAPGMNFAPKSVKFNVEVGETRHLLPSFIAEKQAVPVSRQRGQRPLDSAHQAHWCRSGWHSNSQWPQQTECVHATEGRANLVSFGFLFSDSHADTGCLSTVAAGYCSATSVRRRERPNRSRWVRPFLHPRRRRRQRRQTPAPQSGQTASGKAGKAQPETVEASRVPLDTISTAVSSVITSNQLRSLPFFNRNFLALGLLVSSTHDVPAWSELKDTTFSISGQRPTSNAFLLDGMDNVASSSNQAIPFQVNDAIQEFRVVTANSDAQFGRNIGGVVNIVTRRGTAKFHGSVFGYFASDSINATSPLSVYNGTGFDQAAAFAGPTNAPPAVNTNTVSGGPRDLSAHFLQPVRQYRAIAELNPRHHQLHLAECDVRFVRLQPTLRSGCHHRAA